MDEEYVEMPPISDYYITYHFLSRAKALLDESLEVLVSDDSFIIESEVEVDQELFKFILEVKRCLESIKFKHDVLAHPIDE